MTFHTKLLWAQNHWVLGSKVDGFIEVYDGAWCLVFFGSERYDAIYDKIRYLLSYKKW